MAGMWSRIRRASVRRTPLCAAMVAVICVLAAEFHILAGLGASLVGGAAAWWWLGWRKGAALLAVGLVAACVLHVRKSAVESARAALLASPDARIVAKVREDPRGNKGGWLAECTILEGPARGARIIWTARGDLPVAGSTVEGTGTFSLAAGARNPGEFDRAAWLERMGVAAQFDTRQHSETVTVHTSRRAAAAAKFRHGFEASIVHGLDPDSQAAQVILAMVVGRYPPDEDEMISAFRNSGTLHVFCVSGLHVAMVGGIGWLCASLCGANRRWAVAALLPLVFAYAWVTGNGAPAVRSAWMMAIFLGAFVFRRKPDLLNALGTVLLVAMLWDGRLLFQTGVQLSYGVVAAIAIGAGPASRLFAWIARKQLYLPDDERGKVRKTWDAARAWLASSLSVSLAAALGSTPLTMMHFGLVTPVSLLANLVLLPLVFCILTLGLVAAALYPLTPAATAWINRASASMADASVWAAERFAAIPAGHFVTRRPPEPMLQVYDLPYGAMASVLTDADGRAVMLDCGGRGSFRRTVLPSLRAQGIEPHTILLSHPDGAHMGGGYPVWRALPVRNAVLPVDNARSTALRAWQSDAPARGVRVSQVSEVRRIDGPDGAVWHRLNIPHADASPALADDRCAVWRLDWRGWRILFTSDAGHRTERGLLDARADLRAHVIVAGKHRDDFSLGDDFLTAVNPRVIIAKNPDYPVEERHPPETIADWRRRGIVLVDQMETGGATLSVRENGDLLVRGFLVPDNNLVISRK